MYGNAFLSGSFGDYEINMNLVATQYIHAADTDDVPEYEEHEIVKNPLPYVSQEITQEDAHRIAGAIASKIK